MTLAKLKTDPQCKEVAARVMEATPVVMHFIRSRIKERSDSLVSVPQVRVLAFIEKHPGCSLMHLSEFLAITAASASTMIERLVRGGLVDREVDPLKRRKVVLHLTALGKKELYSARGLAVEAISGQLANLSPEQLKNIEESMNLLKEVFSTVYGAMHDPEPDADLDLDSEEGDKQ